MLKFFFSNFDFVMRVKFYVMTIKNWIQFHGFGLWSSLVDYLNKLQIFLQTSIFHKYLTITCPLSKYSFFKAVNILLH